MLQRLRRGELNGVVGDDDGRAAFPLARREEVEEEEEAELVRDISLPGYPE